jgi:hypothetical protein
MGLLLLLCGSICVAVRKLVSLFQVSSQASGFLREMNNFVHPFETHGIPSGLILLRLLEDDVRVLKHPEIFNER